MVNTPGFGKDGRIVKASSPNKIIYKKNTHQKEDQRSISIKSKTSSERKCPVYVHQLNKLQNNSSIHTQGSIRRGSQTHKTMYTHENDYNDSQTKEFKSNFNNSHVNPNYTPPNNMPRSHYSHHNPYGIGYQPEFVQSEPPNFTPKPKICQQNLFRPENKAIIDKLEESYWAKWKPTKSSEPKTIRRNLKTMASMDKDKIKPHYRAMPRNERSIEDYSNNMKVNSYMDERPSLQMSDKERSVCFTVSPPPSIHKPENIIAPLILTNPSAPNAVQSQSSAMDPDEQINTLKHTDSFILNRKKQSEEVRPHFQQPKCIKLFKNPKSIPNTIPIFLKGGSYPLRSCLKKEGGIKASSHLGKPGSPLILSSSTTTKKGK